MMTAAMCARVLPTHTHPDHRQALAQAGHKFPSSHTFNAKIHHIRLRLYEQKKNNNIPIIDC